MENWYDIRTRKERAAIDSKAQIGRTWSKESSQGDAIFLNRTTDKDGDG